MLSVLQERLLEIESQIMTHPVEMGYAFGQDGSLVWTKEGEPRRLPLTEDEFAQLKGTVFTHNHPLHIMQVAEDEKYRFYEVPYRGLSLEDIYFACENQLAEVRVVDPEYVYSLLPAAGQETFSPADADLFHEAFHFAYDRFGAVWDTAAEVDGFDLDMAVESSLYFPVRVLSLATAAVGMAYSVSALGAAVLAEALLIEDAEMEAAELLDD